MRRLDADPVTSAILWWCLLAERARGQRSLAGRLIDLAEAGLAYFGGKLPDPADAMISSTQAERIVAKCDASEKQVLKARYWLCRTIEPVYHYPKLGERVKVGQRACWGSWTAVGEACGMEPRRAEAACKAGRGKVRAALYRG